MGKISNEELDKLFKNKLSNFAETPSDDSANRIFDSIVDHSFTDKPASRKSLFVLPRFPKTATRYIAVALASAAASVFITLSITELDKNQQRALALQNVEPFGTQPSTVSANKNEITEQQKAKISQSSKEANSGPVKRTSVTEHNTQSAKMANGKINIPNAAISPQSNQGSIPSKPTPAQSTNEYIAIEPPMDAGKTLQNFQNDEKNEAVFAIETDFETVESNAEIEAPFHYNPTADDTQPHETSPADSVLLAPIEIADATVDEEEALQNLPLLKKNKAAPEKVKIQSYASIDAGYFNMDVTNAGSDEPYNGMRTNSFNYALQYKNASISIGAGYAELQTAQNYEIAYRQVDYNEYDNYVPSKQEAAEGLNTEKSTMSYVSEKTATQQTKLSNSYITLPISASYLLRKSKLQTGIKGSIIFIYLINSEETAADFSEYTHIQSTESLRKISSNTVSFEISIPIYYEIWKNTQIFTEIAGQAYTEQFISENNPSADRLLSVGAKAGLQFKL